jgi:hypothetical protein
MIERDIRKEILGQEIKIEKDQEEGWNIIINSD